MRTLRLIAILLAVPFMMAAGAPPKLQSFEKGEITIAGADGSHKFKVEIATDDGQREQGLMFRQQMAADAGMIFVWPQPQPIVMWMENTYIPLDMLFVGEDGVILNIRERAVPFSREQIPSAGPAKAAIELNGGTAAKLGIKAGDKVMGAGFDR